MNGAEYNFWLEEIKKDSKELAEKLNGLNPEISKEQIFNTLIEDKKQALNYLIATYKEVNAYTIARIYSDIVTVQTWEKYYKGKPLPHSLTSIQQFLQKQNLCK